MTGSSQVGNSGQGGQPKGRNRALGAVVFVLVFALVTGGVFVLRQALRSAPAEANGTPTSASGAESGRSLVRLLDDARSAMSQQEYGRAEAALLKAVELFPEDQEARMQLAQTLVTQKRFTEAYSQYEAAIALSPRPAASGVAVAGAGDPKLHFEAGTVANEAGYVERAEEHYSMAQSGDPTEPRYPLYLAMVQIKLGKDTAALASLVRATKLNPDLAIGWGTLAELALKENQLGLAMQHVDKARRLEPQGSRWRVVEARILKRRAEAGDVEKALQLLLSLDKADRVSPDVMKATGECFGLLQRPEDAAYMYAEASKLRPDDAEIAFEAARWYQRLGKEEEALRFGKRAQEIMEKKGQTSGGGK
jgi:tetratricopeptide (TPR) repeat protein